MLVRKFKRSDFIFVVYLQHRLLFTFLFSLLFNWNANGYSPCGSDNTIRHTIQVHRWRLRCQPYKPAVIYPHKSSGTHFCFRLNKSESNDAAGRIRCNEKIFKKILIFFSLLLITLCFGLIGDPQVHNCVLKGTALLLFCSNCRGLFSMLVTCYRHVSIRFVCSNWEFILEVCLDSCSHSYLFPQRRPNRLRYLRSLIFKGFWGSFPRCKAAGVLS
jgi:hypothetical protein